MSADNFYLIRKDKFGFFVPVMGFASNEETPTIRLNHPRYETIEEAIASVENEYAEYGLSVHPECYQDGEPVLARNEAGTHYTACYMTLPDDYFAPDDPDYVCSCDELKRAWETKVTPVTVTQDHVQFVGTGVYELPPGIRFDFYADGGMDLKKDTDPVTDPDWIRHAYNRGYAAVKHDVSDHQRHISGLAEIEACARLREQFFVKQLVMKPL
jgi:hypothetical protein